MTYEEYPSSPGNGLGLFIIVSILHLNILFFFLQLLFYIQDSDDVYGLIAFLPMENQKVESSPGERHLSLSFARLGGRKGDVRLLYSALYIPAGVLDPSRAKDGILNVSRSSSLLFPEQKTHVTTKIQIRNDAFLQNGAHFLIQVFNDENLACGIDCMKWLTKEYLDIVLHSSV